MNKARIHTIYKKQNGERVPGVTTVLNELAKPALIHWAWDLGQKGLDYRTFRDELGDVGSLAHRMILAHLRGEKVDTADFTKNQIDLAENCFLKFLEWENQNVLEPILLEMPLISEVHGYGGTPDFFGKVSGLMTLLDFKTGKRIYDEHWLQIAAYHQLIKERMPDIKVESFRVLNIGRDETELFEEQQRVSLDIEFHVFWHILSIHQLKKQLRGKKNV